MYRSLACILVLTVTFAIVTSLPVYLIPALFAVGGLVLFGIVDTVSSR